MENSLIILTIVQSILVLTLSVAVIYFGHHYIKSNSQKKNENDLNDISPPQTVLPTGNCHFHPQIKAEASCSICEELLCESCAKPHEKIHFCPEHHHTFKQNSWEVLDSIKVDADNTTASEYLYKVKQSLWTEKNIPTYIQVHYQINVESDTIISEVKLFCIKEQANEYRKLIQNEKEGSIPQ